MEDEIIQFNVQDAVEQPSEIRREGEKIDTFNYDEFKKLCGVDKLHWRLLSTGTKIAEPKLTINKQRKVVTVYRGQKVDIEKPIIVTLYRDINSTPVNQIYYALTANILGEEDF